MAKVKIRKIKPRKAREISETRFKEVKANGNEEDKKEESKLEHEIDETGSDNFSEARRTAPTLQQENRSQNNQDARLETSAESAPTPNAPSPAAVYASRNAERGYGQESYTKTLDYSPETRKVITPSLTENEQARTMRETFTRRQQQQQNTWIEDARATGTWRDQRDAREIREYENIEERTQEAAKLTKEKASRRRVD